MLEETYENAKKIFASGSKLLTLGGDHTIPYGMVRAASEKFGKLALLHFDSHQDSTPSTDGNISHANFAYDLQAEGCIDPSKSAQVFIRTEMTECGYNIFYAQDAVFMDMKELAEKLKKIVGDMPVYILLILMLLTHLLLLVQVHRLLVVHLQLRLESLLIQSQGY